jgi:phage FluMu protein Com
VSAQNNSSVYCPRCKTEHKIAVFEQENQRLAAVARKHADFWRGVELECRQQHILSCIAKDIREEGLYLLDKSADNNDAEWDGRKDVSERRFPTLVKAALFSADKATELFIKFVKQWNPLSGKQYTKLIHGRATVCHIFYQPLSEEEAWDIGFHGAACEFKTCLDCEKKQKEQLREMRRNGEKQPPDTTVTINSRADADHCRICTSRNLVKRGCGERRLMFDVEPVPVLQVKCAHCHEIFPPLPRKLPITPTITIDQSMATHRVR